LEFVFLFVGVSLEFIGWNLDFTIDRLLQHLLEFVFLVFGVSLEFLVWVLKFAFTGVSPQFFWNLPSWYLEFPWNFWVGIWNSPQF
jgi:hypothetical protein